MGVPEDQVDQNITKFIYLSLLIVIEFFFLHSSGQIS